MTIENDLRAALKEAIERLEYADSFKTDYQSSKDNNYYRIVEWQKLLSTPVIDLTNHHNVLTCPYCNPKKLQFSEQETEVMSARLRTFVVELKGYGQQYDDTWGGHAFALCAKRLEEILDAPLSAPVVSPSLCEGDCNPYIAPCGARFCSYEEMVRHKQNCQAPQLAPVVSNRLARQVPQKCSSCDAREFEIVMRCATCRNAVEKQS